MKTNLSDIIAWCFETFATVVAACIVILVVYIFMPVTNPFRKTKK